MRGLSTALAALVMFGCGATRDSVVDTNTDAMGDLPDQLDPYFDSHADSSDGADVPDAPVLALEAEGSAPVTLDPADHECAWCEWYSPSAIWDGVSIYVAFVSDENSTDQVVRMARLGPAGYLLDSPPPYLVYKGATEQHNYSDPYLTPTADTDAPLAAVWVDFLGGGKVNFIDFEYTDEAIATEADWIMDPTGPVSLASLPVLNTREDTEELYLGVLAVPSPDSAADVLVASFDAATLDTTFGTDGYMNFSDTVGEDELVQPAVLSLGEDLFVVWATPGWGLKAATWDGAYTRFREIPLPGIFGSVQDIVLVRSPTEPEDTVAYLLLSAIPEDAMEHQIFSVSVDVEDFDNGAVTDENVFGTPLMLSDSPVRLSSEVTACWYGGARNGVIGVAWRDQRDDSGIYFRLVGGVWTHSESSGYLASDEIDLTDGSDRDGEHPSIVCMDHDSYAVVWTNGDSLFTRRVIPST